MEEQDHDFSEFENIKTTYRRALLPWWLWVILLLYNSFTTVDLIGNAYSITQGYVFAFDVARIDYIIPYPVYTFASVALWLGMLVSFILLWLEKKNAARVALWVYGLMLALCAAILVKSLLEGRFVLRYEMIIFIDLVLRLSAGKEAWQNGATRHDKAAVTK